MSRCSCVRCVPSDRCRVCTCLGQDRKERRKSSMKNRIKNLQNKVSRGDRYLGGVMKEWCRGRCLCASMRCVLYLLFVWFVLCFYWCMSVNVLPKFKIDMLR